MKNLFIYSLSSIFLATGLFSCKEEFFEKRPLGVTSEAQLNNLEGAEALLIGAYSILDGVGATAGGGVGTQQQAAGSNWIHGDLRADDAYKGSIASDLPDITPFETYSVLSTNSYLDPKWYTLYDGVARSNSVLRAVHNATNISETDANRITAEARFLRAHYHFDAKRIWNNVPFIDENMTDTRVANTENIWPKIEADLQYAIDILPINQADVGRATKGVAQTYLAKVYLFQDKYAEAKPLLDAVISSGKYGLNECFGDNFDAETRNSKESVFAVQQSVDDGATNSANGGYGEVLNYPFFGVFCCGYFQPSQNLVNAFKTDANGLPLLDTFNETDVTSGEGIPNNAAFTPYAGTLDPRLDYTVGRRGIPYQGFGNFQINWVRNPSYGGPYAPRKNVPQQSQLGGPLTASTGPVWKSVNNYEFIRYSDILLMRAEVAVEENDLTAALGYVNEVRNRAKNGCVIQFENGTPAANYKVEPYPAFSDQEYARKAVRFERRLELAMEGHRFFDLVRWDVAAEVLNTYLAKESTRRTYLKGAQFTEGRDEYLPIPEVQIVNSSIDGRPTLTQNLGY